MLDFKTLGRWRPETLIAAADHLESGRTIRHLGHLHNLEVVVEALRRSAEQLRFVRMRAYRAAGVIFQQGWEFREDSGSILVREAVATRVVCSADLDRIEGLMSDYATALADALIEAHTIAYELSVVIEVAHRDPNERADSSVHRPLRPISGGRIERGRQRRGCRPCLGKGRGPA